MSSRRAILTSLLINIFLLTLCLIFGTPAFGATDDYFMARLFEGVYGENYNVHLTFINVLYGYALLPFYHLFPKIGWYYIGEMTGVFLSFTAIGAVLIKRTGPQCGPILALLFSAAFASDCYLSVQFTQCATLYSAAGMLLFLSYATKKEHSSKNEKIALLISALFFLLWGAIMRREACLMGMPFLALALLINVKDCWINKKWVITGLTLLFIGINAIQWIDKKHYEAPDYKYYKQFQSVRATIGDGAFFDSHSVEDELDELGFYSEDYKLLRDWTFYDTEVFSVDSLNFYIKSIYKNKFSTNYLGLINSIISAISNTTNKPIFWIWLIFCATIFYSTKRTSYPWISFCILAALIGYLLNIHRLVYRVELGFWIYATTLTIPFIGNLPQFSRKLSRIAITFLPICIFVTFWVDGKSVRDPTSGKSRQAIPSRIHYKNAIDFIDSLPQSSVVLVPHLQYIFMTDEKPSPYNSEPFGSWKKIIPMGYWTPYFPDVIQSLQEKGISNPLKDITKENVYVLSNGYLADYIQRHHYKENKIEVNVVKEFDVLKIYKYSNLPIEKYSENKL